MDWINNHAEISVAVAAAIFSVIGYMYKARREKRENLGEALFLLLQIWGKMTANPSRRLPRAFELLTERLFLMVPHAREQFTEEVRAQALAYFAPILERNWKIQHSTGLNSLFGSYERSIALIARSAPTLAYDLDAASETRRRLILVDSYLQEAFQPLEKQDSLNHKFAESLKKGMLEQIDTDSYDEIERHLKGLAWEVGFIDWIKVFLKIRGRRNAITKEPDIKQIDLILKILIPKVEKHIQRDESLTTNSDL